MDFRTRMEQKKAEVAGTAPAPTPAPAPQAIAPAPAITPQAIPGDIAMVTGTMQPTGIGVAAAVGLTPNGKAMEAIAEKHDPVASNIEQAKASIVPQVGPSNAEMMIQPVMNTVSPAAIAQQTFQQPAVATAPVATQPMPAPVAAPAPAINSMGQPNNAPILTANHTDIHTTGLVANEQQMPFTPATIMPDGGILAPAAEASLPKAEKPMSMAQFVRARILQGDTNQQAYDAMRTAFGITDPADKTGHSLPGWHRNDLRKKGLLPKELDHFGRQPGAGGGRKPGIRASAKKKAWDALYAEIARDNEGLAGMLKQWMDSQEELAAQQEAATKEAAILPGQQVVSAPQPIHTDIGQQIPQQIALPAAPAPTIAPAQ